MDLAKLDTVQAANAGFEVELFHPATKENLGIYVTVLGRDSDEHRRVSQEQQRRRVERMTKGGGVRIAASLSPEQIESDALELLTASTKSWRTVVDRKAGKDEPVLILHGEKLECSRANAARVYKAFPWIREQVDDAVNDRANFSRR